jgi:hypothetical protein
MAWETPAKGRKNERKIRGLGLLLQKVPPSTLREIHSEQSANKCPSMKGEKKEYSISKTGRLWCSGLVLLFWLE